MHPGLTLLPAVSLLPLEKWPDLNSVALNLISAVEYGSAAERRKIHVYPRPSFRKISVSHRRIGEANLIGYSH